jgi:predicted  nucleic acid-binding Zn-ribbon protein
MGPTNKALLELFRADTALRQAQSNLDAATRGVRVQRKRAELAEKAHGEIVSRLKHARAQQMELDSDLRARDARIEHLRQQQQGAQNHKHFQTFLVEINTQKTDRAKVEEQAVAKLAEVEELQKREAEQKELARAEHQRADKLQAEISVTTNELQLEIERLEPLRSTSAASVPSGALAIFDKLADNYDGEAMAGVGHIEGRTESYYCTACNMELVVDVYNRLMTRDEVLTCPGCGRLLYVPEELTPEKAVRQKKAVKAPRKRAESASKPRKKGAKPQRTTRTIAADVRRIITTAAAEGLRAAEVAESPPVDAEVFVNGESEGIYKVESAEGLRRLISGKLQGEDLEAEVAVKQVGGPEIEIAGSDDAGEPLSESAADEAVPAGMPQGGGDRDVADTLSTRE